MPDNSLNNKRIAKNTLMLYIRMLLSIVVNLYTSRVVLQVLGVDDFGVYGVVGGVVSMFTFLNASMSGATSRFITFALGKNNIDEVRDTFSTAVIIHVAIALIIVLLAETIGLWFLEYKLVIPEIRMYAARIVYQFSILAMVVTITQVPYNASILSHEKMDVYAYVELLNVLLKLGIVYILMLGNFDKLILYAVLVFAVNILIALIYRIYCVRKFDTCEFKLLYRKDLLVPMLSFSGWDLYGNMCVSLRQQGTNMLINMFYGVAFNAASSIATSVQAAIASFSTNVIQAFRPQIIKNYAQGDIEAMQKLMNNAIKYSLLLFLMVCVPLSLETKKIMEVWLGKVPAFAPEFCLVMLWTCLVGLINNVMCIAIHATGKIKSLSFVSGTLYLITLPIIYFAFRYFVDNSIYAYIIAFFTMLGVVLADTIILRNTIPQIKIWEYFKNILLALLLALVASLPAVMAHNLITEGIIRVAVVFIIYIPTLAILTYFYGIDKNSRTALNNLIKTKIHL